ncbi:MAG: CotH kinase family protein [Eubacterium sp.]|nr:CotH kinase family protein [Eubacterium sp.]
MKKSLKKSISLLLVLVMLLTTFVVAPFSASAAVGTAVDIESTGLGIWADPEGVLSQSDVTDYSSNNNKLAMLGGIQPHAIEVSSSSGGLGGIIGGIIGGGNSEPSKYYLFLPTTADLSALTFWFNGTVSISGTEITSGIPTDVFADINAGGVTKDTTFVINGTSYSVTVIKSGEVGTVYIDTASGSLKTITNSSNHSTSETGTIMVVRPDGKVDYCGEMAKMSGRGNGTWSSSGTKNPYNVKLAVSTSLLGMGKAKKWCLLANAGDSSLIKNQLTYDFAKYIGVNYQPICKPVDLYVNQQYLGSYNLSEKVEIKSNRINISDAYENLEIANGTVDVATGAITPADLTGTDIKTDNPTLATTTVYSAENNIGAKRYSPTLKNPTDITGGYLYELEISKRWVDEGAGFCAYNRQGWVIKNADYATKDMVDYSYNLLFALGAAVYNNGTVPNKETTTKTTKNTAFRAIPAKNPAPESQYQNKRWSDILDADSAVRYYWTQEFFKNMDSSTSSTYFYKDSDLVDTKLYAGPMWDMDNSIGYGMNDSRWGYSWTSSTGWYTKNARIYRYYYNDSATNYSSDDYAPLNFYAALATNCSDFWTMAEKYWYAYIEPGVQVIMGNAVDNTGVLKSAADYIHTVEKSATMNALRFGTTYNAESHISGMTNWFSERAQWIDSQIAKNDISSAAIGVINAQNYTGEEIKPTPVITINGNVTLQEGVDYTFSYENNINVGTATVIVNGFGTYTGTVSKTFTISPADISHYNLAIEPNAYSNMELSASLLDANGNAVDNAISYQWYKNGVAVSGANTNSYVTTADDIGSVITVAATGDGVNLTGSVISNACNVIAGERPVGYTKTIASWDYDYTADSAALVNADTSGADYYYTATGGERQSTSNLYSSANAVSHSALSWSGTKDLYVNDGISNQSPVLEPSTTGWGIYPYFETVVSTAGYEDIKFSAKIGVTKKGPQNWKLQYSLDGVTYTDAAAAYAILINKTMELAFDNVALADCTNQKLVYIRIVAANNIAYNGTNYVGSTGGSASVNNIKVTGSSLSVITELTEPIISANDTIFNDDVITITDSNGGADVYYSVNGGEEVLYTGAFNPFDEKTANVGDTVSITAYAKFTDIVSPVSTAVYTFGGVDIMNFSYSGYSTDVTNGAVQSTGGVYGESGKMTAYTDGKSQYVPLWNNDNGAFAVSPDDGAKWSDTSGFTFKVSTAGYENVNFSCKAYTTSNGPKSVNLQYSTDGIAFYDVVTNIALPANATLEQAILTAKLPASCSNLAELYIRIVTAEDATNLGEKLHNNLSKGNLYINNVIVAGEDNGDFKMPYTNKSTDYFGANGVIQYVSPDGKAMQYVVVDSLGNIVQSGTYQPTGIQLSTVNGFKNGMQEAYTVLISVIDDEDSSIVNRRTYYYKGETVVKFNYNSTTKLFTDYVSADSLSVANTSGANAGTLSMYLDAVNPIALSYTGTYGVKVERPATKPYAATKVLDNPSGNAYWLIETSTLGYNNLTLNLEQLSSNKGPRDWGVAYSLDGKSYTYVANSNVRAISNDASAKTIETYGNLPLPSECDNQEKLFIKVFVNGGEAVDATALDDLKLNKGNTGINTVEINGIPMISTVSINTTVLETPDAATGNIAFGGVNVYVDGELKGTTDALGNAAIQLPNNKSYQITIGGDGIVDKVVNQSVYGDVVINTPIFMYDVNEDGYVNAKDYAVMSKNSKYDSAKPFFENFINYKTSEFSYK